MPAALAVVTTGLAACSTGGLSASGDGVFAPGVDYSAEGADNLETGHRLLAAGQYELAIKAFNRAAVDRGEIDGEILSGLGAANLGLGRLGQAEKLMRRAIDKPEVQPADLNNLGVVLMETGRTAEAAQYFQRAFALSNGEDLSIRDNLRLALAKSENSATTGAEDPTDFTLVRRSRSEFTIGQTP